MELTYTIDKIETTGEQNSVRIIHYTISGTEDGVTESIKRTAGFSLKDGTEDNFVAFENLTEETAISWIKKHLTPNVVDDDGNETDIDCWDEVEQGLIQDIKDEIKKQETNLPWNN